MDDVFTRAMYGIHAVKLPINLIVQRMDKSGLVTGVFQTDAGNGLVFGSKKTHQLILGDAVIRPHLVLDSNQFRGAGIDHLTINGFAERELWDGVLLENCRRYKDFIEDQRTGAHRHAQDH